MEHYIALVLPLHSVLEIDSSKLHAEIAPVDYSRNQKNIGAIAIIVCASLCLLSLRLTKTGQTFRKNLGAIAILKS